MQQYFVIWMIILVYMGTVLPVHVFICLFLSVFPYFDQWARRGTSNNMSLPKNAAPGEVLSYI
jgi:hypothetical protein